MAKCLLFGTKLSNQFWGEAVNTTVYVLNRTLTRSTQSIPYEDWFGLKVSVKDMKIFGSKCFVHIPEEKRTKLDHKAKEMNFIVYDQQTKGFRCYNPIEKRLVISREVKFINEMSKEKVANDNDNKRTYIKVSVGSYISKCRTITNEENNKEDEIKENVPVDTEQNGYNNNNIDEEMEQNNFHKHEEEAETTPRYQRRENRGTLPRRLVYEITEIKEPKIMR